LDVDSEVARLTKIGVPQKLLDISCQNMLSIKTCCQSLLALQPKLWAAAPVSVAVRTASSYFQKSRNQDQLWKAMTSVSNQGRQRGRAKGLLRYKNLHMGQRLGFGKSRISFPGLTQPVLDKTEKGKRPKKTEISTISDDKYQQYEENIEEIQNRKRAGRGMLGAQTPLERGWTGNSLQGKKFGPPISESIDGANEFRNFDSVLLEQRTLTAMDGTLGRVRTVRMLMAVGNKNGTGGFTLIRTRTGKGPTAIQKAINRAGQRLVTVPLYENRTVYHDFFSNFGRTKIMVLQKPPGHGIVAQRVIKSICELIGIKDLEAIVDSSTSNYLHITKAFFLGLMRQRTHQELANEKRLHLVEFRDENDNFPMVVATPDNGEVRTEDEIPPTEILDFETISFDGQLPFYRKERPIFWTKTDLYKRSLKKKRPFRHHADQRLQMMVDQGRIASHLTDKFPECVQHEGTPREAPEGWLELREKL